MYVLVQIEQIEDVFLDVELYLSKKRGYVELKTKVKKTSEFIVHINYQNCSK